MQTLKDDIRDRIMVIARESFVKNGYLKTSMRHVAELSGIGVGNIYNYFKSKDELFCQIVRPVVLSFEKMLHDHHGIDGEDIMKMLDEDYLRMAIEEYIVLIRNHRELISLLLFKSQGSSMEHFKEVFTNRSTEQVKQWFALMKKRHPEVNVEFSDIFIHLNSVWMFAMFEEIIKHNVSDKNMEQLISEYIKFEISGWKCMFNLNYSRAI